MNHIDRDLTKIMLETAGNFQCSTKEAVLHGGLIPGQTYSFKDRASRMRKFLNTMRQQLNLYTTIVLETQ